MNRIVSKLFNIIYLLSLSACLGCFATRPATRPGICWSAIIRALSDVAGFTVLYDGFLPNIKINLKAMRFSYLGFIVWGIKFSVHPNSLESKKLMPNA
ncbi:MAG: hypothetical protein NTV43_09830 [Methylococcales bacterium]|nr:hypothetical protein [Methylococcales bacterium]